MFTHENTEPKACPTGTWCRAIRRVPTATVATYTKEEAEDPHPDPLGQHPVAQHEGSDGPRVDQAKDLLCGVACQKVDPDSFHPSCRRTRATADGHDQHK